MDPLLKENTYKQKWLDDGASLQIPHIITALVHNMTHCIKFQLSITKDCLTYTACTIEMKFGMSLVT